MSNESISTKEVILAFQRFGEALQEFVDLVIEAVKPRVQAFLDFCQEFYPVVIWIRRYQLYLDLKSWHSPDNLSWWLAERWPVRFLPGLRAGP